MLVTSNSFVLSLGCSFQKQILLISTKYKNTKKKRQKKKYEKKCSTLRVPEQLGMAISFPYRRSQTVDEDGFDQRRDALHWCERRRHGSCSVRFQSEG